MVYDRIYSLLNELLGGSIEDLKSPLIFKGMTDFPGVIISPTGLNLFEMRQIGEDQKLVLELLVCPGSKQVIPLSYQDDLGLKWTFEREVFNFKSHREICIFLLGWLQVLQGYHFKKEASKDPGENHMEA